jgi:hypothetical protein
MVLIVSFQFHCILEANNLGFCLAMALARNCQGFGQLQCKADHGVSIISHTEPSQHCNITHWIQMKGFSKEMLSVLAPNNLGFGLAQD